MKYLITISDDFKSDLLNKIPYSEIFNPIQEIKNIIKLFEITNEIKRRVYHKGTHPRLGKISEPTERLLLAVWD